MYFYINFMNLLKPFKGGLKKGMPKAACLLGGVDSSNPCRRRGWWLHHHGGGVRCVFVLCVAVLSSCPHSLYVKKYKRIT
jgi:hypothetical protein